MWPTRGCDWWTVAHRAMSTAPRCNCIEPNARNLYVESTYFYIQPGLRSLGNCGEHFKLTTRFEEGQGVARAHPARIVARWWRLVAASAQYRSAGMKREGTVLDGRAVGISQ